MIDNGKIEVLIKWKGEGGDLITWEFLIYMYKKYLGKKKI